MKRILYLIVFVSCLIPMQTKAQMRMINRTTFVNQIYPNMEKPTILLFGRESCPATAKARTLVLQRLAPKYSKYVDFFYINVDIYENKQWLFSYNDEYFRFVFLPGWVLLDGSCDDDDVYYRMSGAPKQEEAEEIIEDLIDYAY